MAKKLGRASEVSELPEQVTASSPESAYDSVVSWPASAALLMAWISPVECARRTRTVTLLRAFGVHLFSAVLTVMAIVHMTAWAEVVDRYSRRSVQDEVFHIYGEAFQAFADEPVIAAAVLLGVALAIEAGFVVLAFLMAPWGAADEPIRDSIVHALRRVWLHTMHFFPLAVICGAAMVLYVQEYRNWYDQRTHSVTTAPPRLKQSPTTRELQQYQEAVKQWQKAMQESVQRQRNERPWLVKYGDVLNGYGVAAGILWYLVALLRGIIAPRPVPPHGRPPMCDFCGYNLIATPMDSRCPECGVPVVQSLGPEVRPGTPWEDQNRRLYDRWRQCTRLAWKRPDILGRQMRVVETSGLHRTFFAVHIPILFTVGMIGVVAAYVADTHRNPWRHDFEVLSAIGPFFGAFTVVTAFCAMSIAAWLTALHLRWSEPRNMLGAAFQAACWRSWSLIVWSIVAYLMIVAGFALMRNETTRQLIREMLRLQSEETLALLWLAVSILMFVMYLSGVVRTTLALRYANR